MRRKREYGVIVTEPDFFAEPKIKVIGRKRDAVAYAREYNLGIVWKYANRLQA